MLQMVMLYVDRLSVMAPAKPMRHSLVNVYFHFRSEMLNVVRLGVIMLLAVMLSCWSLWRHDYTEIRFYTIRFSKQIITKIGHLTIIYSISTSPLN